MTMGVFQEKGSLKMVWIKMNEGGGDEEKSSLNAKGNGYGNNFVYWLV